MIIKPAFFSPIKVNFSTLEIHSYQDNQRNLETFIISKVMNKIQTELTRPWREVLGSDTE